MATIQKKSSMAGGGCLLQGLGIVSFVAAAATFFTIIGPIIFGLLGLWLIWYGSKKAQWFECSDCGTKLSGKKVIVCPYCGADFI